MTHAPYPGILSVELEAYDDKVQIVDAKLWR